MDFLEKTENDQGASLRKFLDNQYVSMDGVETKLWEGIFTISDTESYWGLGQALDENQVILSCIRAAVNREWPMLPPVMQSRITERRSLLCFSIGPGAANMVTSRGNRYCKQYSAPSLAGDVFASRQPDPVLQQIEQPASLSITTNDAFKPVCKYWDRVNRPSN